MNISTTMDQIGSRLATISGLRVFDFPAENAQPPFALVDFPESVEYDSAMARGADRATFNVLVGVSRNVDRAARDALAAYMDGSGSKSIKTAIEGGTVGDSARVTSVTVSEIVMAGVPFVGAVFVVDVIA